MSKQGIKDLVVPTLARRSYCTILGIDLAGHSKKVQELQLEDFFRFTRQILCCVSKHALNGGNAITIPTGDGVFIVLENPQADESLDLLDAIYRALTRQKLIAHYAVHAGTDYLVNWDIQGRPNVIGHTINTCARILHAAADGQILVSGTFFDSNFQKSVKSSWFSPAQVVVAKFDQKIPTHNYCRIIKSEKIGIANVNSSDLDHHPLISALRYHHANLLYCFPGIAARNPRFRSSVLYYDRRSRKLIVTRYRVQEWVVSPPSPSAFRVGQGISGRAFKDPGTSQSRNCHQILYLDDWNTAQDKYLGVFVNKKYGFTRQEVVRWRRHARTYIALPLFSQNGSGKPWGVLSVDSMIHVCANEHEAKTFKNEDLARVLQGHVQCFEEQYEDELFREEVKSWQSF